MLKPIDGQVHRQRLWLDVPGKNSHSANSVRTNVVASVCVCLVNTDFLLPLVLSFRVNVSLGFALMWVFLCVIRSRDKSSTLRARIAEMLTVNR